MTLFDEAETKVENLVGDLNIPLGVEGALLDIIDELRDEYAPTVKMTDAQYKILVLARNNAVNRVDKVGLLEFMSAYSLLNLEIDHLSLMQAWLHPKTIKIVDE
ncbi:hypothetical protein [Leuconostoc pseudomesenteroides]|uniref:hypothetical protein n=1 Tax=Leuconostoc pseudomesenteroides TaxID=33968 RepID=UPI00112137C4|nr:hypothetical protein [Leuconostoc pseudomesenteroides]TOZ06282.1 hypothetical protein DIS14_05415 [Leuconostoc pseudomesenteroides]